MTKTLWKKKMSRSCLRNICLKKNMKLFYKITKCKKIYINLLQKTKQINLLTLIF